MTWLEFEVLVGEAFRQKGYKVQELGGTSPDGGVDLVLTKGSEKFLVQCKQWKAFKVGVDVVRELYGVMAAKGAAGGFVVTSGRFTADATVFASGRNVTLIDGVQLFTMLQSTKAGIRNEPITPTVSLSHRRALSVALPWSAVRLSTAQTRAIPSGVAQRTRSAEGRSGFRPGRLLKRQNRA
jgi:restriction system protein